MFFGAYYHNKQLAEQSLSANKLRTLFIDRFHVEEQFYFNFEITNSE